MAESSYRPTTWDQRETRAPLAVCRTRFLRPLEQTRRSELNRFAVPLKDYTSALCRSGKSMCRACLDPWQCGGDDGGSPPGVEFCRLRAYLDDADRTDDQPMFEFVVDLIRRTARTCRHRQHRITCPDNLEAAVEHRVDARRTSESNHSQRLFEGNAHPQEVRDGLLPTVEQAWNTHFDAGDHLLVDSKEEPFEAVTW